jgi:hypothetical protein
VVHERLGRIVQAHGSLGVWHQIAHDADDFKPRSRLLDGWRLLHSVTYAASDRIPAGQDVVHEQVVDDDRVGTDSHVMRSKASTNEDGRLEHFEEVQIHSGRGDEVLPTGHRLARSRVVEFDHAAARRH